MKEFLYIKQLDKILDSNMLGYDAALILKSGRIFLGNFIGEPHMTSGEICFTTAMSGYQEVLTDPSYAGQIVTFTFPHIGNVGVNKEDEEAKKPCARGLVVREDITNPANFRSTMHLKKWLEKYGVTAIYGIDTRSLTKYIGKNGLQNAIIGSIRSAKSDLVSLYERLLSSKAMIGMELAREVCIKSVEQRNVTQGGEVVVVMDFGAKQNIIRCLEQLGCSVYIVPADTSAEQILDYKPKGVVLSNGPGDPAATAKYAECTIKKIIDANIPILGICLGHQLLALALGGKTVKMHCGHRGINHPVKNLLTNKVEITSHNHGFAVEKETLPDSLEITHISLFDQTIEGLRSKTGKLMSTQYHPESSPGTHESMYVFSDFLKMANSA